MNHHLLLAKTAVIFAIAPVALAAFSSTPTLGAVVDALQPRISLSSLVSLPSAADSVKTASSSASRGAVADSTLPNRRRTGDGIYDRETAEAQAIAIADKAELAIREDGLPLAALTVRPADESAPDTGLVAVLLPQTHRYPGSESASSKNDEAVVVQRQLEDVLTYLTTHTDVHHILVEGETYGPIGEGKVTDLRTTLDALEEARRALTRLKQGVGTTGELAPAFRSLDSALASAERQALLEGAPYTAVARGASLELYGLENRATLDASAEVVRDYIYQQDRLQQLQQQQASTGNEFPLSRSIDLARLRELQQLLRGSQTPDWREGLSMISRHIDQADRGALTDELQALEQAFADLSRAARGRTEDASSTSTAAPARTDNPYAKVTSPSVLRDEIKRTESRIESLILDQRNEETAMNFVRLARDEATNIAAIQIGAQHTEGLAAELQERGVTVLVMTPAFFQETTATSIR